MQTNLQPFVSNVNTNTDIPENTATFTFHTVQGTSMNHFYSLARGLLPTLRAGIWGVPPALSPPIEQTVSLRWCSLLGRASCLSVFSACKIIDATGGETPWTNHLGMPFLLTPALPGKRKPRVQACLLRCRNSTGLSHPNLSFDATIEGAFFLFLRESIACVKQNLQIVF